MKQSLRLLEKAIDHCGGQAALGRAMGDKSQQYVWHMLNVRQTITAEDALAIHKATDGVVSKHRLRPDIFGDLSPQGEVA